MGGGYRGEDYRLDHQEPSVLDHATWDVPWSAKVPGTTLAAVMVVAWLAHIPSGGMLEWGLSASALSKGHYETIPLHMFAHGGLWHIAMNTLVLLSLGGLLTARFGRPPVSWARFLTVFFFGGLSGAAFFLLIHPSSSVPMLGASGAICAVIGLLLRLPGEGHKLHPIRSERTQQAAKWFIKSNLLLIAILTVPALLMGRGGGVAWEAHLGGLLFGFFLGPMLLPPVFRILDGQSTV